MNYISMDRYNEMLQRAERAERDLAAANAECTKLRGWVNDAEQAAGKLCADRDALQAVVNRAAAVMHGDGVMDQGQAWDECLRLLDAARARVPK